MFCKIPLQLILTSIFFTYSVYASNNIDNKKQYVVAKKEAETYKEVMRKAENNISLNIDQGLSNEAKILPPIEQPLADKKNEIKILHETINKRYPDYAKISNNNNKSQCVAERIAVLNLQSVREDSDAYQRIMQAVKKISLSIDQDLSNEAKRLRAMEKNLTDKQNEIKGLQEIINKKYPDYAKSLSDNSMHGDLLKEHDKLTLKQQEYKKASLDFQNKAHLSRQEAKKARSELSEAFGKALEKLDQAIMEIVSDISERHNISLVIASYGINGGNAVVLYANKNLDITSMVITKLNQNFKLKNSQID